MKSKIQTPFAGQNIISRSLPKTGQTIEYLAGDDGTHEAGWWKGRLNANNKTRFIIKLIGAMPADHIILDRATGLMWARDGNAAGCNNGNVITWANAITYANGLTFAGFDDWRLPNINELASIANYEVGAPCIWVVFTNTKHTNCYYWSSTTSFILTTFAHVVAFAGPITDMLDKDEEQYLKVVRKGL